jgi:putative sugar O-methyltransferase
LLTGISSFDSGEGTEYGLGGQAMCDAARRGDLDSVRRLHKSGADVRVREDEPLCRACEGGHLDVVRYLHQSGAKLNARDNEPLCRACQNGHIHVVRYLHGSGAKLIGLLRRLRGNGIDLSARHDEPLCRACEGGHLDVVRYLHEHGVQLNARNNEPLLRACAGGHLDIARYLQRHGVNLAAPDNEPLCRAAAAGHLELVLHIHQNGGDVSARNSEPLRRAAAGGHLAVVRFLHENGAAARSLSAEATRTIDEMRQELLAAPAVDHPSAFWKDMGDVNARVLEWSGEANFKRTLNQNYFNFIPFAADDARMVRMRRLTCHLGHDALESYRIEDPDCDPSSWISCYPDYYIFKEPDRAHKREVYREYLARMYEYALRRDRSDLLATLEEPTLGNPIRVHRDGRLVSQDIVNAVRERNAILAALGADGSTQFTLAELGAGYGRLGYLLLKTTACRYFVFDIPPALYLSQWYLTTLFPGRRAFRFRRFDKFEEIENDLLQADLAFFTPNQLAKFPSGHFDGFATISSIHEMRRDQISHYMALMGRTTRSALYLKQQKNYVNPVDKLLIGKNDYPVPAGWTCAGERFDPINPGFFERIYRRDRPFGEPHPHQP